MRQRVRNINHELMKGDRMENSVSGIKGRSDATVIGKIIGKEESGNYYDGKPGLKLTLLTSSRGIETPIEAWFFDERHADILVGKTDEGQLIGVKGRFYNYTDTDGIRKACIYVIDPRVVTDSKPQCSVIVQGVVKDAVRSRHGGLFRLYTGHDPSEPGELSEVDLELGSGAGNIVDDFLGAQQNGPIFLKAEAQILTIFDHFTDESWINAEYPLGLFADTWEEVNPK